MSIATLKKKTNARYNNVSVGHPSFSLNGTRRSAGYVGQDTLGRSLVRSLSRNGALKGHGGCCGEYPITQIKTSPEMAHLNDGTIVKSSSLNNSGLISTKYRWIRRPNPFAAWKPDDGRHIGTQSFYIDNLARKTIMDSSCHIINTEPVQTCCNIPRTNYNFYHHAKPIVKPNSYTGAVNASDFIRNLNKKCGVHDKFYVRKNTKGTPFACAQSDPFADYPDDI